MAQQAVRGVRKTAGAPPSGGDAHVAESIGEISALEAKDHASVTIGERIAGIVTAFAGSMLFVWVHVAWFSAWTLASVAIGFDTFPFPFLTMLVSLEAIFLSTFVLISQNRQALHADRRAKIDLQVNVIAEREVTEIVKLVSAIHDHLGIEDRDKSEVKSMSGKTDVTRIGDAAYDASA